VETGGTVRVAAEWRLRPEGLSCFG